MFCSGPRPFCKCSVVSEVKARKVCPRRRERYFVYLRGGHILRNCSSDFKCLKFKERHNLCIRDMKSENNTRTQNSPPDSFENRPVAHATNFISHYPKTQSLLQTALATISNINETQCIEVRILLDPGSQKTYISGNIARQFNLRVFETENVLLQTTFWDIDPKPKALSRVKFCLRNNSGKLNMYADLYSVPKMCHPINRQSLDLSEYHHLQGLRLANNYVGDFNIDILLGADFYWQIITGDIRRGDRYGPAAVGTKLRYVLSDSK